MALCKEQDKGSRYTAEGGALSVEVEPIGWIHREVAKIQSAFPRPTRQRQPETVGLRLTPRLRLPSNPIQSTRLNQLASWHDTNK